MRPGAQELRRAHWAYPTRRRREPRSRPPGQGSARIAAAGAVSVGASWLRRMAGLRNPSYGAGARSVLVLEGEIGPANGSGQPRLLPCELELRRKLGGDFHPIRELESDRPLLGVVERVHHID